MLFYIFVYTDHDKLSPMINQDFQKTDWGSMDHGLREAAFDGQTEEVSWLLAEGGDVTAQDINGDTPLMIWGQPGSTRQGRPHCSTKIPGRFSTPLDVKNSISTWRYKQMAGETGLPPAITVV